MNEANYGLRIHSFPSITHGIAGRTRRRVSNKQKQNIEYMILIHEWSKL